MAAEGRPHEVVVRGLEPAALEAASAAGGLRVFAGEDAEQRGLPAVAGAVEVMDGAVRFRPRFPFVSGVRYVAKVTSGDRTATHAFEVAAPQAPPPRVVAVYPSGDALPENTLRLYVQFSAPMRRSDAARHVRLVDETGVETPLAFVPVPQGLWDPRGTRLTLVFHPGRVKRGVAPGERLGPPLRAGRRYALVIDGAMADAAGTPMGADHVRPFHAVAADRRTPSPGAIEVHPPADPAAPAVVRFGEPLDHGLLQRLVWIEDAQGRAVDGELEVGEGETRWSFRPREPWGDGAYAAVVSRALEDRAGNRFDRPFDREDARPAEERPLRLVFRAPSAARP